MSSLKKKDSPKNRATIVKASPSRPTHSELKSATKKVMKQYKTAIKNLARR